MTELADYIIDIYTKHKDKQDIENLVNCALSLYYDDTLNEMYPYVKKSLTVTLFLKDIETILSIQQKKKKKSWMCFSNKKQNIYEKMDEYIYDFIYKNKLPTIIYNILILYRKRNVLSLDEIKLNPKSQDLFLILKYEQQNILSDKIQTMSYDEKINLLKKIIIDIKNI